MARERKRFVERKEGGAVVAPALVTLADSTGAAQVDVVFTLSQLVRAIARDLARQDHTSGADG